MIRTLTIKNYAIIEELVINFSDNLTIITGETGAGKSIMLVEAPAQEQHCSQKLYLDF